MFKPETWATFFLPNSAQVKTRAAGMRQNGAFDDKREIIRA
jgi:hypothetical protein